MALIDDLSKSQLGLKGVTPEVPVTATKLSPSIVLDPTPGSQGDEEYLVKSDLDLDGKIPRGTYRTEKPEGSSF